MDSDPEVVCCVEGKDLGWGTRKVGQKTRRQRRKSYFARGKFVCGKRKVLGEPKCIKLFINSEGSHQYKCKYISCGKFDGPNRKESQEIWEEEVNRMRKWSVIEMLPHLNRGIGSNNDTYINAVKLFYSAIFNLKLKWMEVYF